MTIFKLLIITLIVFLTACKSEVDKCLDAEMAAWTAKQERINSKNAELSLKAEEMKKKSNNLVEKNNHNYFPNINWEEFNTTLREKPDERSREEVVAERRFSCMRAANIK